MCPREWIASHACIGLIERIVTNPPSYATLVDIHVIPLLNPDGYEYSYNVDRFWRKNRSPPPTNETDCYGVDLNRNFDVNYGVVDSSDDPCSENYKGIEAFDQLEVR